MFRSVRSAHRHKVKILRALTVPSWSVRRCNGVTVSRCRTPHGNSPSFWDRATPHTVPPGKIGICIYDVGLIRKLKPYCSKTVLAVDERKKLRYRVTAGLVAVVVAATG